MDFKAWNNKLESITEATSLDEWLLEESTARYSIEVNFRSALPDIAESFAKICLGFVSAALKQNDYHIKQIYDEKPIRILVSSRNWDDGEWVGLVSFNPDHEGGSFVISKGFYNRDRRSVSIQSSHKCKGNSAADIAAELRNMMFSLKKKPDRHQEKLNPVKQRTGPKR